mmetsp:Transcript_31722/g.51333  ORF Transcript_31722/g.51333 Transcript_31722/m.51333 type:complete len:199 (-) Transcript_31722:148-744(-)
MSKLYALEVKIQIEKDDNDNDVTLEVADDCEWAVDLKQTNSDEERKGVIISAQEEIKRDDTGSDNVCNFVMKWPGSKKQSYLTVMTELNPHSINSDLCGDDLWTQIIGMKCNGIEPIRWNITADTLPLIFALSYAKGDDDDGTADQWETGEQDVKFECQIFIGDATTPTIIRILDWRFIAVNAGGKGKGKSKKKKAKK